MPKRSNKLTDKSGFSREVGKLVWWNPSSFRIVTESEVSDFTLHGKVRSFEVTVCCLVIGIWLTSVISVEFLFFLFLFELSFCLNNNGLNSQQLNLTWLHGIIWGSVRFNFVATWNVVTGKNLVFTNYRSNFQHVTQIYFLSAESYNL